MEDANWLHDEIGDPHDFVLGLVKECTPEKADALQAVVDAYHITFAFDESTDKVFYKSNAISGLIRIGLYCSTRLVTYSYAYLSAYYAQLEKVESVLHGTPVPLDYDKRLRAAFWLLTWATTEDIKQRQQSHNLKLTPNDFPNDLVKLMEACLCPGHQDIANQILSNALVFILYHEIAHIQNGDSKCKGFDSIEQEKQADRMAANWMLDSTEINPNDKWWRQAGIALALGWLTAPTVYLGPGAMTTHPHAHDRLFQVIDRVVDPDQPSHNIWMFVQLILTLHIYNCEVVIDEARTMGANFRGNCNYLIDLISKLPIR